MNLTLFNDLKTILESKGVTVNSTNIYDLADEILEISTKSKSTNHTIYNIKSKIDDDGTPSWIHEDTTRKLTNLKSKLANNLLTQNISIDYDNQNIQALINLVNNVVIVQNTSISLSVTNTIDYNGSCTISPTLKNTSGSSLTGSNFPIIISIDGVVITTINSGGSYSKTNWTSVGTHTITATYNTSSLEYNNSNASSTCTVKQQEITKSDSTCSINVNSLSDGYYVGTNLTLTGNATSGGTIYYYEGSTFLYTSGTGGTCTINNLSEGTHYYHAYYSGNDYYNPSTSSDIGITISKHSSDLSVNSTGGTIYIGETSVTINAYGTGTVTIYQNGTLKASGSGGTSYTFTPSSSSTTFSISNSGSSSVNSGSTNYTVTATSKVVTPSVNLSLSSTNVSKGSNVTATVTGTTGANLQIYLDSTSVASSTSGSVSYTFTANNNSYTIKGSAGGNGNYNFVTTNDQTVTVNNLPTNITAYSGCDYTYYGWYVYVYLSANGVSLPGKTVTFTYNGTTKTGEDRGSGIYRVQQSVGNGDAGTLSITVNYAGDSTYNSSSLSLSIPIYALPTTTTGDMGPTSISSDGSGGTYSSWSNLTTGNSSSSPASSSVKYVTGGATTPPNIVAGYSVNLPSNAFKVTNATFNYATRLNNNSNSSSPSMSATVGRMWVNGTLVIDSYGSGNSMGNWVNSSLSSGCNVTPGIVNTRIIFPSNTGYGSGIMYYCNNSVNLTYKYIPSQ